MQMEGFFACEAVVIEDNITTHMIMDCALSHTTFGADFSTASASVHLSCSIFPFYLLRHTFTPPPHCTTHPDVPRYPPRSRRHSQRLTQEHHCYRTRWACISIGAGLHQRKYGQVLYRAGHVAECPDVSFFFLLVLSLRMKGCGCRKDAPLTGYKARMKRKVCLCEHGFEGSKNAGQG